MSTQKGKKMMKKPALASVILNGIGIQWTSQGKLLCTRASQVRLVLKLRICHDHKVLIRREIP